MTRKMDESNGDKIKSWTCTNKDCGYKGTKVDWGDQVTDNTTVRAEPTLGFNGPNGNGYNYWCPKCDTRMNIDKNTYSALDNFFGFNQ